SPAQSRRKTRRCSHSSAAGVAAATRLTPCTRWTLPPARWNRYCPATTRTSASGANRHARPSRLGVLLFNDLGVCPGVGVGAAGEARAGKVRLLLSLQVESPQVGAELRGQLAFAEHA